VDPDAGLAVARHPADNGSCHHACDGDEHPEHRRAVAVTSNPAERAFLEERLAAL